MMIINKLPVVIAAACVAQAAVASDAVNAMMNAKVSVAAAPAVSAPVQLTDAEMDKVAAGGILLVNHGGGFNFLSTGGQNGTAFIRTNPANGALICKNICF
jgi:hypothetical protein